uniref:glycine zipper 2TM domain-containing protein n=1 Tax=Parerythrobacter lutipelagi TaxID=1964208 RepID=UPI0010F7E895|nr:glycine zipper 2TM domain-containing protein [Parerythrobacter lutipelagi]
MTSRQLLAVGTAGLAMALASPAAAQPEMTYEGSGYQYAVPAPAVPAAPPRVVYQPQPVVQPIPATSDSYEYETEYQGEAGADYSYEGSPYPAQAHAAHADHGYVAHPQPQSFDREAWLDQCRANMRQDRRGGSGGVTGGVLGAVAGGVIGNRVADGDRLAGTLIGAGVGGLAGAAIGSAIESGNRRSQEREYCEAYLDRYLAGGYGHHGAYPMGQHHYGQAFYGYAYQPVPVMYVQVMVPVQRRAVVREYVEYINEPVTIVEEVKVEEVVRHRVIEPAPTKTIPIKRAPQRTKYVKDD